MSLRQIAFALLIPLLFLVSFLLLAGNRPAHADYYKYTDKTGAICISNKLDAVPPRYRATMKVIREETLEKKDRSTRQQTPRSDTPPQAVSDTEKASKDEAPAVPPTAYEQLSARFPWLTPLLFLGAVILLFFIVGKISALMPSPQLAKIIYLVFFLGVFVFAYKCYADHLLESYTTIKSKIFALFEKANRREMPAKGENLPSNPEKD